jgi:hypothetical protein
VKLWIINDEESLNDLRANLHAAETKAAQTLSIFRYLDTENSDITDAPTTSHAPLNIRSPLMSTSISVNLVKPTLDLKRKADEMIEPVASAERVDSNQPDSQTSSSRIRPRREKKNKKYQDAEGYGTTISAKKSKIHGKENV